MDVLIAQLLINIPQGSCASAWLHSKVYNLSSLDMPEDALKPNILVFNAVHAVIRI
jgi:hypothetical protein